MFNDNISNTQLLCTFPKITFSQNTKLNAKNKTLWLWQRKFFKKSSHVKFYKLLIGSKLLLVYNISIQNKYKLINEWIKSHDIWKSGISLRWPIQLGTDLKKFYCSYFSFPICTQSNTDWSVTASDGSLAVESWSTFCSLPTARFEQKVGPLDAVTELECKKELSCSYQFHHWEASASFQCPSLFLLADNKQTNPWWGTQC